VLGSSIRATVVDNSSSAECRAATEMAGAAYIDTGSNLGFARGVNRGLCAIGEGVDVLLLNPDATVDPATVEGLHRQLRSTSRRAAVAPALVGFDGRPQRVGWPFPSPAGMWLEAFGGGRWRRSCDFLVGSVLLLRAEALAQVGPFDERFFLYAEEADWQRRARDDGWHVALCPNLIARHRGAGTSQDTHVREAQFHCAHETFIRKWHGAWGWRSYQAAALAASALRSVRLDRLARRGARERAALYWHGPCRSLSMKR